VEGGPDDLELLEAWRAGDDQAGSQLFERRGVEILRFFNNKVPQDAEDLVQQTFMACVESRDRFRQDSSFRGYLYGIARRVLLMHLRTRSRARRDFDPAVMSVLDSGMGPVRAATRGDEQQVLAEAMAALPVDFQICLELYYWENLEVREIAAALDAPEGTIKSRLSRARTRLEEQIRSVVSDERLLESTLSGLEKWTRAIGPTAGVTGNSG
jgi:RNA polymerase sigma-70 factor (ECF subfamily)